MASPSVSASMAALWLRGQSARRSPTPHMLHAPSNQHAQMAASLPSRRFSSHSGDTNQIRNRGDSESTREAKPRVSVRGPRDLSSLPTDAALLQPPLASRFPSLVAAALLLLAHPPPSPLCRVFQPEQASQLPAVSRDPPSPELPASLGGALLLGSRRGRPVREHLA